MLTRENLLDYEDGIYTFVLYLSDYCHITEKGEIKYSGTPADLRANQDVLDPYLTL